MSPFLSQTPGAKEVVEVLVLTIFVEYVLMPTLVQSLTLPLLDSQSSPSDRNSR